MADIHYEISVAATQEQVYQAITAREGLTGWWTDDATGADKVGAVAEFGFFNHSMIFRMRVDELEAGVRVKWSCIGGPEEWLGTHVLFGLVMLEGGATSIAFTHGGWRAETGMYPSATATWGHIMPHLKGYVEGKMPGPYFKRE